MGPVECEEIQINRCWNPKESPAELASMSGMTEPASWVPPHECGFGNWLPFYRKFQRCQHSDPKTQMRCSSRDGFSWLLADRRPPSASANGNADLGWVCHLSFFASQCHAPGETRTHSSNTETHRRGPRYHDVGPPNTIAGTSSHTIADRPTEANQRDAEQRRADQRQGNELRPHNVQPGISVKDCLGEHDEMGVRRC